MPKISITTFHNTKGKNTATSLQAENRNTESHKVLLKFKILLIPRCSFVTVTFYYVYFVLHVIYTSCAGVRLLFNLNTPQNFGLQRAHFMKIEGAHICMVIQNQCCLNSSVRGQVFHSNSSFRSVAVSKSTLVFT